MVGMERSSNLTAMVMIHAHRKIKISFTSILLARKVDASISIVPIGNWYFRDSVTPDFHGNPIHLGIGALGKYMVHISHLVAFSSFLTS
jgi:hypothetical protein